MASVSNKVVIITGASSGIGEAAAHIFASEGATLALAARREEKLAHLANILKEKYSVPVFFQPTDVSQLSSVKSFVDKTIENLGRIDVLVNNAGVGCVGKIADVDLDLAHQVMETNFFGPLYFIQEVVPHFRKQQSGHVVNISSVIGKRSVPRIGLYCASKFALQAATDALRLELKKTGIRVSMVCPGLTATEFPENQLRPDKVPPMRMKYKGQSSEHVAKQILKAVTSNKREIHLSTGGKFLVAMERISPSAVDRMLALQDLLTK